MSSSQQPPRAVPAHPSAEYLRKQAKRLAKSDGVKLATAQWRLARSYGFGSWAELMKTVERPRGRSPLSEAAARADVQVIESLLADGAAVDGEPDEVDTPLFLACGSDAPADRRIAAARLLIEAGAFLRRGCSGGATPLHAAASRGPAELVELLLRSGALYWQPDEKGRRPHDYAQAGKPLDRGRILYMLKDEPRIEDEQFRAAVAAIHLGDVAALERLLDAHPRLLRERAIEPDFGVRGYFSDPKLFWFVANNPTLVPRPPDNIVEVARLMIDRGVDQDDLDYTLELVMTDSVMPREMQMDLVRTLTAAGAKASYNALLMTLGHRQTKPIAWLIGEGKLELTAAAAAGLGRLGELRTLLATASAPEKNDALATAVINRETEAARLALEAGADPNLFMPVHAHSTPLHQAALDGDLATIELLVSFGARTDLRDTLWHGTPLGWAEHGKQRDAADYLRSLGA